MKIKHYIMNIVIIILLFINAYGNEEKKNINEPATENNISEKIILLPFYNYADSGMKYLSMYIPELLKNSLFIDKETTVLDADDIKGEMKRLGLTSEDLYERTISRKFLSELNASYGVIGRYIVQGKNIRIDFMLLNMISGEEIKGKSFKGVIDDRFLTSLGTFSVGWVEWIKDYIIGKKYPDLIEKEQNIFLKAIGLLKKSRLGVFIQNKWILFILILILFFILSIFAALFFDVVLKRLSLKTETNVDNEIVEKAKKPTKWIVIFFGVKLALFSLGKPTGLSIIIDNLSTSIVIILITYISIKSSDTIIRAWGKRLTERIDTRIDEDLVPLFMNISRIVVTSIGILMVLSRFDIDIAPLIASLGIVGFAIGFAVKDSLANIIGGIVLILDHSFAVGDKVTIDDDTGIIKEVGLRNTKLMTFDHEIIVIPNGELINKKFKNFVLPDPTIRVVVNFSVVYGTDVDKVEEVVLGAIKQIKDISENPEPAVVFREMAEFSLNFQAKLWVPDYVSQYDKKIETTKVVYNALNEAGIAIPFPTHTIYLEKDT